MKHWRKIDPPILEVRIADFGAAFSASSALLDETPAGQQTTAAWFRAPEAIMGETVTHKIDCWAFGCHLVALFFGRPLFIKYCVEQTTDAYIEPKLLRDSTFGANEPGGLTADSALAFIGQIVAFGWPPQMTAPRGSSWPLADKLRRLSAHARPPTATPFLEHTYPSAGNTSAGELPGVKYMSWSCAVTGLVMGFFEWDHARRAPVKSDFRLPAPITNRTQHGAAGGAAAPGTEFVSGEAASPRHRVAGGAQGESTLHAAAGGTAETGQAESTLHDAAGGTAVTGQGGSTPHVAAGGTAVTAEIVCKCSGSCGSLRCSAWSSR